MLLREFAKGLTTSAKGQSLLFDWTTMSVYRALQAARFLPSLVSAAPYSLSRSSIKFSRFGLLWALIQLSVYVAHFYINSVNVPTYSPDIKSLLLDFGGWLLFLIGMYGLLKDGLCQKNIIYVVRSMDGYDKRSDYTNDKNGQRENERVRLCSFAYSAVIVVLALARYLTWRTIGYFIIMEMVVVQIDNGIYMFAVLTTLLGLRLRHLNSIVNESQFTMVRERGAAPEPFGPGRPECFRELYTSLHATGERLNNHYSDRLLLWSAFSMISFLRQIYVLLTEKISTLFIAALIVQIIPIVLGLLLYCVTCQFTVGQGKKIISALLEKNIRHSARINRGRKEIFTMGLYMALQPFEFSALGFFSVDFSLIFAIVATTAIYLTLCIQAGGD